MKNTIYHISEADPYYIAQSETGAVVIAKDKKQAIEICLLNKAGKIKKIGRVQS